MKKIKKRGEIKKRKRGSLIILLVIIIFLLLGIYLNFFYVKKCKDGACFENALARCKKASLVSKQENATWFYIIKGTKHEECVVYVKNLEMLGIKEAAELQGKDMLCYLPLGAVLAPEEQIADCHGLLKEGLQDLIIKKLHLYIIQNIGKIKEVKPL